MSTVPSESGDLIAQLRTRSNLPPQSEYIETRIHTSNLRIRTLLFGVVAGMIAIKGIVFLKDSVVTANSPAVPTDVIATKQKLTALLQHKVIMQNAMDRLLDLVKKKEQSTTKTELDAVPMQHAVRKLTESMIDLMNLTQQYPNDPAVILCKEECVAVLGELQSFPPHITDMTEAEFLELAQYIDSTATPTVTADQYRIFLQTLEARQEEICATEGLNEYTQKKPLPDKDANELVIYTKILRSQLGL